MSNQPIFAVIHQYHPSLFFSVGMFLSVLLCVLATFVEFRVHRRECDSADSTSRIHKYQRFHHELVSRARHVGFTTDDVHELEDHEFHA